MTARIVVWFSAGAPSAVTAKLTLAEHGHDNVAIAYTNPGSEHPDNERFLTDCEAWFDHPVIRLHSDRYADTWDVWTKRRYLVGPTGALCTTELKKMVRFAFQRPDDIQCFGYTADEMHRVIRFRQQNPGVDLQTPLIGAGLTKADCLGMVDRAGIALPAMYLKGYENNNCIGCPKGGMGYWNKIRRDFPVTFDRMAKLERHLDATCLRDVGEPLFLDQLDPTRGNYRDEANIECSLLCVLAEDTIELGKAS